jgi:Fe2+ or Zn2+ uptake regulation protein
MVATGAEQHRHEHVADLADLHATVAERLRVDGQRYTTGRRRLVELLADADRPLTIAELLEGDDRLAQSSAYRNLTVLEGASVVRRVVTDDEYSRFELTEDLTGHHHHLICSSCGRVDDFTISPQLETSLARAFARVARDTGFEAEHHRLDLVGTCSSCS